VDQTLIQPNPWMVLPFLILLAAIALGPLLAPEWWSKHYPKVAISLAIFTLVYYLADLRATHTVAHTAREYLGFMALIGSLFVVAGGIHITVKGEATPLTNVLYLAIGAVVANVLGTTGAAMLMIRPWLRMNKYRITAHHVVFFIFIVANVGGCLTPIGDPPLFLGYLKGIPFWWVAEHCWPIWMVGVGLLLAVFFVVDYRNYLRAPKTVREELAGPPDRWRFEGLGNLGFLAIILGAVFVTNPPFLREALMLAAALGSYYTTAPAVHEANHFNFHPIEEVAILFIGIFATMMPALDWLQMNAGVMGEPSAAFFYWGAGSLSSVLDNAPTYLSFLKAVSAAFVHPETVSQVLHLLQSGAPELAHASPHVQATVAALHKYYSAQLYAGAVSADQVQLAFLLGNPTLNHYIVAVSIGAVFFGANTYIGNGPNFMVKSIADHQKVHTPGFLAYIFKYSLPLMLPTLLAVWWIFFS
jgi:Na+/H+ antiporter NhaD/arsenite permease-like protein